MIADTKANDRARNWSKFYWCFSLAGHPALIEQEKFDGLMDHVLTTAETESPEYLPWKA